MASPTTGGLRFKDKVAIVTGGCNGIGRGCVDVFVEHGGKVAILDIDEKTGNSISTSGPGEIYFIRCDITNEEELKNAITSTYKKFGRIDCLVNNAGNHPGLRVVDEIPTDVFKKFINLLLIAPFIACRETLPYLRQTKGSIVNITSMSGAAGQALCADYCAAKCGLAGLTKSLACDEAKHGVRVNAIAPGPIMTPLQEQYIARNIALSGNDKIRQTLQGYSHAKRFGETREIGLACLFLAVDATFTTGEELHCSGGSAIGYGVKVD